MGMSFPIIIRNYLQNNLPSEDEEQLPKLLTENQDAKIEFIKWAETHPALIQQTPRLLKVLQRAVDPTNRMEQRAANVNSLVQFYFDESKLENAENDSISLPEDETLNFINAVLNNSEYEIKSFPPQYTSMALELLDTGTITFEQLIVLFSRMDSEGKLVLENTDNLKEALPLLAALVREDKSYKRLYDILVISNRNSGKKILHNPDCFKILTPFFYKNFNYQYINYILSARPDRKDETDTSEIPLHDPLIFEQAIPLLRNLLPQDYFYLFSAKNGTGSTPLHNPLILKMAIEFLEAMPVNEREDLWEMKDDQGNIVEQTLQVIDYLRFQDVNGKTPLHDPNVFRNSLSTLKELPPETLIRILKKVDSQGVAPFHISANVPLLIPLLDKLSTEQAYNLLSMEDGTGKALLHYTDSFNHLIPYLEKLSAKDLELMLSTPDADTRTPLFNEEIFKSSVALLEKATKNSSDFSQALFRVLSKADYRGVAAFHISDNVPLLIPLLDKLSTEQAYDLLSMKDGTGKALLHYTDSFNHLIPYLEKLSAKDLELMLSTPDANDRTPLFDTEIFKSSVALLEKATKNPSDFSQALFRVLNKVDKKNSTAFHNYRITRFFISLLDKLTIPNACHLIATTDKNGKTLLHFPDTTNLLFTYLEKLPSENLKFLLSAPSKDGNIPVHLPNLFKLMFPLIEKLSSQDQADLFSVRNSENLVPLSAHDAFQAAIPLLKKMPADCFLNLLLDWRKHGSQITYKDLETAVQMAVPFLEYMEAKPLLNFINSFFFAGDYDRPVYTSGTSINIFKLLLPFIQKLKHENQLDLFKYISQIEVDAGNPTVVFEMMVPFLEKLDQNELLSFFSLDQRVVEIKRRKSMENKSFNPEKFAVKPETFAVGNLLFNTETFEAALSFLNKLEPSALYKLFSYKNELNQTFLNNSNTAKAAIPLLRKLNPEDLFNLLSIQGKFHRWDTVLHNPINFTEFIPFLQTLDKDLLFKILTLLKDSKGKSVLEDPIIFYEFSCQLDGFEPDFVLKVLSHEANNSSPLMHNSGMFDSVLPYLQTKDEGVIIQFLSIKDKKNGTTPLTNDVNFKEALPLLLNLSDEGLSQLFMIQDFDGNSLLHVKPIFKKINKNVEFYGRLKPEAFQVRNAEGLTPLEWHKLKPSQVWLEKNKFVANQQTLSEEEYNRKSLSLKQDLNAMWESLTFGDEDWEVPNHYLELEINNKEIKFTPADIQNALNVIVDKIIAKLPWLGTPPKENKEKLHGFYSLMLTNFEQIMAGLSSKVPHEKAAPLINIAKVELERRCAGAYQSEIGQNTWLSNLDSNDEEGGLKAKFNQCSIYALKDLIETIVRKQYHSDSHAYNQMLYAVGLESYGDPLTNLTTPDCLNAINESRTKEAIISSLTQIFGRLSLEELQSWFEELTPDDFGQPFLEQQADLKKSEKMIVDDIRGQLQLQMIAEPSINTCIDIFQSTQGAALRLGSPVRKYVSNTVFNKMQQAMSAEELQEAKELFEQEKENELARNRELLDQADSLKEKMKQVQAELLNLKDENDKRAIPMKSELEKLQEKLREVIEERKPFQDKIMGLKGEFNSLELFAERRIKLAELIQSELVKKNYAPLSKPELEAVFSAKLQFDGKITELVKSEKVDFVPQESGLPSKAVERSRRIAFAYQFLTPDQEERLKLNKMGATKILLNIGVLEIS